MENNPIRANLIRTCGTRKIILGAGRTKRPGYLTADAEESYQPDIVMDLEAEWYFPDEWFEDIFAESIIEHLVNVPAFINRCHDALSPGGRLTILTPYWSGTWATGDPTHIHFFNEDSFNGWTCWFDGYRHLNHGRRFAMEKLNLIRRAWTPEDIRLRERGFGAIDGMEFILKKIKGGETQA